MATLLKHGGSRTNETLDELRRATAAVARAIGRTEEIDVEFVTENPVQPGIRCESNVRICPCRTSR